MNRTTEIHSQGLDNEGHNQKLTEQHSANDDSPRLVACVLLLPEDAEVLAGILCNLATNSHASQGLDALAKPDRSLGPAPSDSWLPHVEAAKFLGVSISTYIAMRPRRGLSAGKLRDASNTVSPHLKDSNKNRYALLVFRFDLAV